MNIGIFGAGGVGKLFVLDKLKLELDDNSWRFFEGTDILLQVSNLSVLHLPVPSINTNFYIYNS